MELIVHAGTTKAGSTALQDWFDQNRYALREHGVFYPHGEIFPGNHHILLCGSMDRRDLPENVQRKAAKIKDPLSGLYRRWIDRLRMEAPGHDITVLSSEAICSMSPTVLTALREDLAAMFDSIRVSIYVRRPSSFYLSEVQQRLKSSDRIRPPSPIEYTKFIESMRQYFTNQVDVHSYEDARRHPFGIVGHFGDRYAPAITTIAEKCERINANTSMSAEGMSLLLDYRRRRFPNRRIRTPDIAALIRTIRNTDPYIDGFLPPTLFSHICDYVDETSTDLLWLRDEFALEFAGVNYERIRNATGALQVSTVEDICPVDQERRERLMFSVLESLL